MIWNEVSTHDWDLLERIAAERDKQKGGFASSRYWNERSHFHGLLGELAVATERKCLMDLRLDANGDGGTDFPGIDVKTSTFCDDPHLKHPVNATRWTAFYVLVVLDVPCRRTRIAGHATAARLKAAPARDYGRGPMHSLPEAELSAGLP